MTIKSLFLTLLIAALGGSLCAQTPNGAYSSPAIGGSSSSGAAGAINDATIYISSSCGTATNCFAATSGNTFFDCTYANASPTLTCGATDVLTPFATGTWRVIVTCCAAPAAAAHIGSALEAPAVTTVLSVNNAAHTITMNQNATVTRATIVGQIVTIVQDQTTVFQNAANAGLNVLGHCGPLSIGAGVYGVRQGFANSATCSNKITSQNTTGWGVTGAGPGGRSGTTIVPLPDFDFSTCTGQGSDRGSCFFGIQGAIIANLAIYGGDNSTTANSSTCGTNTKSIIDLNTDSLASNILLAGWCANDTALRGMTFDIPGEYCFYCIVDGAGGVGAFVPSGSGVYISHSFFGDSNGVASSGDIVNGIINSGILQTVASGYGIGPVNSNFVQNNGEWQSDADRCLFSSTVVNTCYRSFGNGRADISLLSTFGAGVAGSVIFSLNSAGSTLHMRNDITSLGGTGFGLGCGSGKAFDEGGNVLGAINCAAGTLFGTQSITGTALIATNVTANTSWGTSGAAGNGISAPLGDSHLFTFTVTAAGVPAANPTLAVTFPTAYFTGGPAPSCSAQQIGGTGAIQALTTTTGPSITAVTFTWNGTPVAASTYIIQGRCQ